MATWNTPMSLRELAFRGNNPARLEWHNWLAWHPVQLPDGSWTWGERVQRRLVCVGFDDVGGGVWHWEYQR